MIVKSLLFIIVCIYVYETYTNFIKQKEEYFSNNTKEIFNDIPKEYLDIDHTIQNNCKHWNNNKNKLILQSYIPPSDESLDTPYSSRFKPLLYNKNQKYYWNSHYLIEEGQRRYLDDKHNLDILKQKYDAEQDPDKKEILENELSLYDWQNYIFKRKNNKNEQRDMPDIITDYYPDIIGQPRYWVERHSHLTDYKRKEIDPVYKNDVQKYDSKSCYNQLV